MRCFFFAGKKYELLALNKKTGRPKRERERKREKRNAKGRR
jgi:hypothetical protein